MGYNEDTKVRNALNYPVIFNTFALPRSANCLIKSLDMHFEGEIEKNIPEYLTQVLYHLPYYTLLLDEKKRIIMSDNRFLSDPDCLDAKEVFGMGPGDILQCENATPAGCGNSSHCRFCDIYRTIAECNRKDTATQQNK